MEVVARSRVAGGAANAAAGVQPLGGQAAWSGSSATTRPRSALRGTLDEPGVRGEARGRGERPDDGKTRIIADEPASRPRRRRGAQRAHYGRGDGGRAPRMGSAASFADAARGSSLRLREGYGHTSRGDRLRPAARQAGIPIVVDPKGPDFAKYAGATVVTPNVREAREASRIRNQDDAALDEVAADLRGVSTVRLSSSRGVRQA